MLERDLLDSFQMGLLDPEPVVEDTTCRVGGERDGQQQLGPQDRT